MKKIKQTFHVSDMIEQLVMYSHMIENGEDVNHEILEKSTKISLILMAGYSSGHFLPEEVEFVTKFMNRIARYASDGGYNEF